VIALVLKKYHSTWRSLLCFGIHFLALNPPCIAGNTAVDGHVFSAAPKLPGKIYYLGISTKYTRYSDSILLREIKSDSDLVHFDQFLQTRCGVRDSGIVTMYGPNNVQRLQAAISELTTKMTNEDIFIFHYAGFSIEKIVDPTSNKAQSLFYFQPPDNTKTPGEYFTLAMLKYWLDMIPARNQILVLDGGSTAELKMEIIQTLTEHDLSKYLIEKRKRVVIANYGMGLDIKSGGLLTSSLLHVMGSYKYPASSFQAILSDRKPGLYFQYQLQHTMDSFGNAELNMIREWEIVSVLHKFHIEFKSDSATKNRGDNIVIGKPQPTQIAEKPPTSYALIVATENYQFLEPLVNPVFDGEAIEKVLSEKFHYQTKMLRNCYSSDFYNALLYYNDSVAFGPHDQLLIYVAGHGAYNSFMNTGAIAFVDALPLTKNPEMKNYLSHVNLINMMSNIPCSNMMVILDVCYGGTLAVGSAADQNVDACRNVSTANIAIPGLGNKENKRVLRNLNCANRYFLTSGGKEYVPDGTPGAHSPFSSALLDYLKTCKNVSFASEMTTAVKESLEDKHAPVPSFGRFGTNSTQTEYVWYTRSR
jgi:hypothetical protein